MPQHLLIRADASKQIGTGHVMRMLALAQAWRDRFQCHPLSRVAFACREIPDALAARLRDEGLELWKLNAEPGGVDDARETMALADNKNAHPQWVVADGYHFDLAFQRTIREAGARLAVMDDNGENGAYDCDVILNQNIMARESMYVRRNPEACLLLGTQYSLLRREFQNAQISSRSTPEQARNLMITFGGADTAELIGSVVRSLSHLHTRLHIRCVLGSLAGAGDGLNELIADSPHHIEVLHDVRDMTGVMQWADLSINAAGSTTWELCAMGVPMILTVLADNQREIAKALAARGCAVNAGDVIAAQSVDKIRELLVSLAGDSARRRDLVSRAHRLVDGQGASRVVGSLLKIGGG